MDVTLVLSTHNELRGSLKKPQLEELIRQWAKTLEKVNGSLLIADARSRDGTLETLKNLQKEGIRVLSHKSSSRSKAVRAAYEQLVHGAFGGYVCHIDLSLKLPPELFLKIWEIRLKAPLLLGKRQKRLDAFHEIFFSRLQWLFCKLLFWKVSSDPNMGLRIYQTSFLKPLLDLTPRWVTSIDLALTLYAFQSGVKILEIPVISKDRPAYRPLSFGHFTLSFGRVLELLAIRLTLGSVRGNLRALRMRF